MTCAALSSGCFAPATKMLPLPSSSTLESFSPASSKWHELRHSLGLTADIRPWNADGNTLETGVVRLSEVRRSCATTSERSRRVMPKRANTHRFAVLDGIETLYKFRPYTTDQDRRRVREILVDHKLYFARASQLNDAWDLQPDLRFRGALSEARASEARSVTVNAAPPSGLLCASIVPP